MAEKNQQIVTILHTNDFHNKLSVNQANYIKRRRSEVGENSLLVDAGDAISAGNVGVSICGEPILQLMSQTGYDMMTMGNREFHVADGILRHKIGEARFPILCANISYQKAQPVRLPLSPYVIKNVQNGIRIGVIGVTVPMVTVRMAARIISSYLFDDPINTVSHLLPEMKKEADVVIALTHIGYKEDIRLAQTCPNLDLIVGGHSHAVLPEAVLVNGVPIVQAGWYGHYLGVIELAIGNGETQLLSSKLEELPPYDKASDN